MRTIERTIEPESPTHRAPNDTIKTLRYDTCQESKISPCTRLNMAGRSHQLHHSHRSILRRPSRLKFIITINSLLIAVIFGDARSHHTPSEENTLSIIPHHRSIASRENKSQNKSHHSRHQHCRKFNSDSTPLFSPFHNRAARSVTLRQSKPKHLLIPSTIQLLFCEIIVINQTAQTIKKTTTIKHNFCFRQASSPKLAHGRVTLPIRWSSNVAIVLRRPGYARHTNRDEVRNSLETRQITHIRPSLRIPSSWHDARWLFSLVHTSSMIPTTCLRRTPIAAAGGLTDIQRAALLAKVLYFRQLLEIWADLWLLLGLCVIVRIYCGFSTIARVSFGRRLLWVTPSIQVVADFCDLIYVAGFNFCNSPLCFCNFRSGRKDMTNVTFYVRIVTPCADDIRMQDAQCV